MTNGIIQQFHLHLCLLPILVQHVEQLFRLLRDLHNLDAVYFSRVLEALKHGTSDIFRVLQAVIFHLNVMLYFILRLLFTAEIAVVRLARLIERHLLRFGLLRRPLCFFWRLFALKVLNNSILLVHTTVGIHGCGRAATIVHRPVGERELEASRILVHRRLALLI